jgi:SAM-dependent methyltransferase
MSLYNELAMVYHIIYQKLFDYDQEADFYHSQLGIFNAKSVIEFGCGTGNLGSRLIDRGYEYFGVDISAEMIDIAKENININLLGIGDIVNYNSKSKYHSALFTGRALSYLVENEDIIGAFSSVADILYDKGIFIFDAIDGPRLFNKFDTETKHIKVESYIREARSKPIDHENYIWQWTAEYYDNKDTSVVKIGEDNAYLRAFDKELLSQFLKTAGFEIIAIMPKFSYIWDDHYYICQKI